MSLCYEWPMASGSACCVSLLDKHDQVHQTGATAWSLCPDVPECDLLLPQDITLGNISNYSIWTGFLHAVCNPITNGMFINCITHNYFFCFPFQRTAFATPACALIKAMTMPLANFDFDEMFHLSDDEDEIAYVGASYLMWIAFVIILAILFQNLLVSLPFY